MEAVFPTVCQVAARTILDKRKPWKHPEVIHPEGYQGARRLAKWILEGSDRQFQNLFRIKKATFYTLVTWLRRNEGLEGFKFQTAEQKVMVVLYILGQVATQRQTAHFFRITQSSVSRTIRTLLLMLVSLHTAYVVLGDLL